MTEYHGWITLCSTDKKWADDDWDAARQAIQRETARFSVEDGHHVSFAETTNSMQTVLLSGHTEEEIASVVRFMEFVAGVVPDSYGELVAIGDTADLSRAARFRLAHGRVLKYDTSDV